MMHSLLSPAMDAAHIEDYLKDTPQFLRMIESIRRGTNAPTEENQQFTEHSVAFSLVVDAMCTYIDWQKGARATTRLWTE